MTIELFTLCDGAYNYNDKLTIVGSWTSISVNEIPAKIPVGVAMRIRIEAKEKGKKEMKIHFLNPDGTKVPTDIAVSLDIKQAKEITYINLAAMVQGFPVTQVGQYVVKVISDNDVIEEYPFVVEMKK